MLSIKPILAGLSVLTIVFAPVAANAKESAASALAVSGVASSGAAAGASTAKGSSSLIFIGLGLAGVAGLAAALAGGGGGGKDRPASP